MATPIQKQENPEPFFFSRVTIAEWYGIKERALRLRFKKVQLHIENRMLTINEVLMIFKHLGIPSACPKTILLTILTYSSLSAV